ncbi:MAG: hypothetical protein P8I03_13030, partial [Thalassotalea sp.]|nr:hypothetical protein [Thalassotalea sp.]
MLLKKYICLMAFRWVLVVTSVSLFTSCSAEKTVSQVNDAGKDQPEKKQAQLKAADSQLKVTNLVNDGPYIFKKAEKLQAFWLCNGAVEQITVQNQFIANNQANILFDR